MNDGRSPDWEDVRKTHLFENEKCAICGEKDVNKLEVHHILPFHIFPEFELHGKNLVTLCGRDSANNHHLLIGHLGDWDSINPQISDHLMLFKGQNENEIKKNRTWMACKMTRPTRVNGDYSPSDRQRLLFLGQELGLPINE